MLSVGLSQQRVNHCFWPHPAELLIHLWCFLSGHLNRNLPSSLIVKKWRRVQNGAVSVSMCWTGQR